MPISRIIDGLIISESEFQTRKGDIASHLASVVGTGKAAAPLQLSMGRELPSAGSAFAGNTASRFTPIGPNLPLTVKIEHVYTGRYPERAFLTSHRGDMAIFSGVKNFASTNASARAVNYLEPGVAPNTHFNAPTTFNSGTPVILYLPAVVDAELTISIELAQANSFDRSLLDAFASGLQSLGNIPLLLPFAGYLLAANRLLKLGESVTDALYQAQPPFIRTEVIRMSGPGDPAVAAWRFVCNSSLDTSAMTFVQDKGLVDKTGALYSGDEPYVVISLDGRTDDDLKGFAPAVASAAVLQQFLSVQDGASTVTNALVGAVSLYSDLQYRNKADNLKAEINDPNTSQEDKAALQANYNAVVKNIVDNALKPAS